MNEETNITAEESTRLANALAALPREVAPGRDLWPQIAAQIRSEQNVVRMPLHRRWLPMALAASVAIAFCAAVGGAYLGYGLASRQFGADFSPSYSEDIDLAYATARAEYLRQLAVSGPSLDPAAREALQRNLAVIDRALGQVRAAMQDDPDNPMYLEALLMTRESEMDMLDDMNTETRL